MVRLVENSVRVMCINCGVLCLINGFGWDVLVMLILFVGMVLMVVV